MFFLIFFIFVRSKEFNPIWGQEDLRIKNSYKMEEILKKEEKKDKQNELFLKNRTNIEDFLQFYFNRIEFNPFSLLIRESSFDVKKDKIKKELTRCFEETKINPFNILFLILPRLEP